MAGFDERFGIDQEAFPVDPAERRRLIDEYRSRYLLEGSRDRANRRAIEMGHKYRVPEAADWSVEPDAWAAADTAPSQMRIPELDEAVAGARNQVTTPMPQPRPEEAPQGAPAGEAEPTANIRAKAAADYRTNQGAVPPIPPPIVAPRTEVLEPWEEDIAKTMARDEALKARRARQGTIADPEAGVRGMNQGATLNWGEEIGGLQAASGVPGSFGTNPVGLVASGLRTGLGGLRLLGEKMGLPGQAGERYDAYVQRERERNAEAAAQHPRTYYGSEIAGGLAIPVPGATATKLDAAGRLVPAFGRRMAASGTQGAIAGAGGGEGVHGKLIGGTLGAGIGAALPAGHAFVQPFVGRPMNAVRNYFDPAGAATRAIGGVVNDQDRALAAAAAAGRPVAPHVNEGELRSEWARTGGMGSLEGPVVADVAGTAGGTLTRAASNADTLAETTVKNRLQPRRDLAGPRLISEVDQRYAQPSAARAAAELTAESGRVVSPAYNSVFHNAPEDLATKAPFFTHISNNSPHVQAAENKAADLLRTDYSLKGKVWGGIKNAEYWDEVKQALDRMHTAAEAKPGGEARIIDDARKQILLRMDKVVPGYKQARGEAEGIAKERSALAYGTKVAKQSGTTETDRIRIAALPPEERKHFVEGFMTHLKDLAGNANAGGPTTALAKLRMLQQTPGALSLQESRDAIDIVRRASGMRATEEAALKGSSTAKQLQSADLVSATGAGLGAYSAVDDRADKGGRFWGGGGLTVAGVLGLISRRLPPGTSPIIAQRIAEGMMSQDPAVVTAARRAFESAQRSRQMRGNVTARAGRTGALLEGNTYSGQE